MKTLFYSILAIAAFCMTSTNATATSTLACQSQMEEVAPQNGEDESLIKIKIHFERGRKNEEGVCHDRGICELTIEIAARVSNPGDLDGQIVKDRYGNVSLVIEKYGMEEEAPIDITGFAEGPGTFYLSNNADLPAEVKSALGLPAKYQFKAGSYQVTETPTTYVVNFRK